MNIELLQQLCEASAVSGDEQEVRDILINTLEPCVNEITFDGLGSFVARKGNKGPKVAGSDSNLLIVFYVQIMPDDLVMQLHRF